MNLFKKYQIKILKNMKILKQNMKFIKMNIKLN